MVVAYPASFMPACWVLMRTDPTTHPLTWLLIREMHRPTAAMLKVCPAGVRRAASDAAGAVRPTRGRVFIGPESVTVYVNPPRPRPAKAASAFDRSVVYLGSVSDGSYVGAYDVW